MKEIIRRLDLSVRHINIIDSILQQHEEEYRQFAHKLESIPTYNDFLKEIYVGGKGRQMILGDLIEYILTGRAYYFATKNEQYMKDFVRILMNVCNLLLLMENISVEPSLRKRVLEALEREIGEELFEGKEVKEKYVRLKEYDGLIIPAEKLGGGYEDVFDSILPKRVGIVPELLVYCYFIRKNYGYIIPLLTHQRLLGKGMSLYAPDFLLLRRKGEVIGLEVGAGPTRGIDFTKQRQISEFSSASSIPVLIVGIGSPEQPQPYRCGKCKKWILYCEEAIELCADNKDTRDKDYISCIECKKYKSRLLKETKEGEIECPDIVYYGKAHDYYGEQKELRYHYHCVRDDELVQITLERAKRPRLIGLIPTVYGIEELKEED